jgi:hypothetical protein
VSFEHLCLFLAICIIVLPEEKPATIEKLVLFAQ